MTTHELFTAMSTAEGLYQIALDNLHQARRDLAAAERNANEAERLYLHASQQWGDAIAERDRTPPSTPSASNAHL